jgi:hypothetical protein
MIYISPIDNDNMAYNIYKQIPKFREHLKSMGIDNNIPKDVFGKNLMLYFGMNKKTAMKWIIQFKEVGLIEVNDNLNIIKFK